MTQRIERLAFRVVPCENETFDSWLWRLLDRHEIDLRDLLKHLDCDLDLLSQPLGRGSDAVKPYLRSSYVQLIETLAWSIELPKERIERCAISGDEAYQLPAGCQIYGCLVCWMRALRWGKPTVIEKQWTYRASWLCHFHDIPLHTIEPLRRFRTIEAREKYLSDTIGSMRAWIANVRVLRRAKEWNRQCIDLLILEQSPNRESGYDLRQYYAVFSRNRYHFSPARIQLMALAHRPGVSEPNRFDNFVDQSKQTLLSPARCLLKTQALGQRPKPVSTPMADLMGTSRKIYHIDLGELLLSYSSILAKTNKNAHKCLRYTPHDLKVLREAALRTQHKKN